MAHSEIHVRVKAEMRIIPLGQSGTDQVVMHWLKQNGINPDLITGYTIVRKDRDLGKITLECIFTDPTDTEVTGLDAAEPEFITTLPEKE